MKHEGLHEQALLHRIVNQQALVWLQMMFIAFAFQEPGVAPPAPKQEEPVEPTLVDEAGLGLNCSSFFF